MGDTDVCEGKNLPPVLGENGQNPSIGRHTATVTKDDHYLEDLLPCP